MFTIRHIFICNCLQEGGEGRSVVLKNYQINGIMLFPCIPTPLHPSVNGTIRGAPISMESSRHCTGQAQCAYDYIRNGQCQLPNLKRRYLSWSLLINYVNYLRHFKASREMTEACVQCTVHPSQACGICNIHKQNIYTDQ